MTEYRVGQRVRVEDVQEGTVTRVEPGLIYVDGVARMTTSAPDGNMTRTITILSEPKPDEPTGPGAVVLDRDGNAWSRTYAYGGQQRWESLSRARRWLTWGELDAVEILFPGVES